MEAKFFAFFLFLNFTKASEVFLVFYPGPTQENSVRYTINNFADVLEHPQFNWNGDLYIFSYGNLQSLLTPPVQDVINAHINFNQIHGTNFVAVDYIQNWILDGGVQRLGDQLGVALLSLFNRGYHAQKTNLIGFGTAAHIVSVASTSVFRNGHVVSRVTGLSPTVTSNSLQIGPNVAQHVDIIHTNTAMHGNPNAQALAIFYANGGARQPWCGNDNTCSHDAAMRLWAESVDTQAQRFPSLFCSTWENFCSGQCNNNPVLPMGFWSPFGARGFFHLQTYSISPFSRNDPRPDAC